MLDTAAINLHPHCDELFIHYDSPTSGQSSRVIKPVGLRRLKDGQPGIVAECRLRNELRTFGFNRISSAQIAGRRGGPSREINPRLLFEEELERLQVHEATIEFISPQRLACYQVLHSSPVAPQDLLFENMMGLADFVCGMAPAAPSIAITISLYQEKSYLDVSNWVETVLETASAHSRMHFEALKSKALIAGEVFRSQSINASPDPCSNARIYACFSLNTASSSRVIHALQRKPAPEEWVQEPAEEETFAG